MTRWFSKTFAFRISAAANASNESKSTPSVGPACLRPLFKMDNRPEGLAGSKEATTKMLPGSEDILKSKSLDQIENNNALAHADVTVMDRGDASSSKQEWELEAALRRLEAVEGELKVEAGARAIFEREAADWGRQVALLQAQLKEAATLLEETAAPDRLRTHLRQQQLQQQVEELKSGVLNLSNKCEQLTQEKEQLNKEHKKREQDLREQLDQNFGSQLRNIDQQWRLNQEKQEQEFNKQLKDKEREISELLESNQSFENVVYSLRSQLQNNSKDKKDTLQISQHKDELAGLREAHQKANLELSSLRSKHAILREENCALYAKVEDLESCEEVLRQVQARAKMLEAECLGLQAEKNEAENEAEALYSRWRCSDQEALRFKRLYMRSQTRKNDAIPEEPLEEEAESSLFRVVDEVDAAEKGASRLRAEEMPTGQGSVMTWVEKCEQLRSELRMSEASSASLGTRLENEQLRSKSLLEDKTRLLSQNKELTEKVAHLHRATTSMARSKLLMNQYEMKIGSLENERGHLQKALAHLETQLNKTRPDNSNLEQQAKLAVLLSHHNEHLKHTENMLRWKVEQLEDQVKALETGLGAVGEQLEESATQVVAAWAELSGREEASAALGVQLASDRLRSQQLERRLRLLEGKETKDNPLRPLVDELAAEVAALKNTLRGQRQQLALQDAPGQLQQRLAAAALLQKLNQQKEDVQQIKNESGGGVEWAARLEAQLSEMIAELDEQKQRKAASPQAAVEEVQGHDDAEFVRLRTHLRMAEHKCQELENEKAALEAELRNLETCVEQKEQLLEDQKNRLQLEVQRKDLEIKKCQTESAAKQVELLICRSRPAAVDATELGEGCCPGHLEEVGAALEAVHAQAVARLRHEMAASEARLLQDAAIHEGRVHQTHLAQLEAAEEKAAMEEEDLRHKLNARLIEHLKGASPSLKENSIICEKGDWQWSEKLESEIGVVLRQMDESWGRQAEASRAAHLAQAAALAAQSQAQLQEQLSKFHLEFGEIGKRAEEGDVAQQKLEVLLKEDKDRHNQALLGRLEHSVATQFNKCLQEFWRSWKAKNLAELSAAEDGDTTQDLVGRVEAAAAELSRCYQQEAAKLQEMVGHAHSELALAQQVEQLRREKAHAQLRHQQELDELRTYFESRCAKMNQNYSEVVLSNRKSNSIAEEDMDESPVKNETQLCDTFSEPPSYSVGQKEEWRERLEAVAEGEEAEEVLRLTLSPKYASREVGRSLRASIDAAMFMKSRRESHGNMAMSPHFDVEHEVARRMAEQNEQLHQKVDSLISDLKQQSQEQMAALQEESRRTVDESVRQREHLINELEIKFNRETEKLKELHDKELEQLEQQLEKEHHEQLDLALREMNKKLSEELEGLEALLAAAHAKEVQKLQDTIQNQESMLESEQEQMQALLAQERSKTVAALGDQLQSLLADEGGSDDLWPPELKQLKLVLAAEAVGRERRLQEELHSLKQQLQTQLPLRDQFLQQKQVLSRENELLRGCVAELVRYLSEVDAQLNSFVEASPNHNTTCGSDTESNASDDPERRPVHLAPDLSAISSALTEATIDSDAVERMRQQLDSCLLRLRKEVADIVGVSEASLVGNKQLEELQRQLSASEGRAKELESRLAARSREVVSEAVGAEGTCLGMDARLQRLALLHDRARVAMQDHVHLEPVLRELCSEGQHLADEARQEKDDLLMQLESADKKVRAHRSFLDEQAVEREQERDEFSRQLQHLRELLRERERDRQEAATLAKEVENLESQVREQSLALQKAEASAAEALTQLQTAKEKVVVLREVVVNLEYQLEAHKGQSDTTQLEQECEKNLEVLETKEMTEIQKQLRTLALSLQHRTKNLLPDHLRASDEGLDEGRQSPDGGALKWVRRLQAQVEKYERAEQATLARFQNELQMLKHSEEELQVERAELQRRVDEQMEQISTLQASVDHQRIQQNSAQDRSSASLRHVQIRSSEQLDLAKETIAVKDQEVKELRATLEKSKRAMIELESEAAKRSQEAEEEIERLREQLEAAEVEAACPKPTPRRRLSIPEPPEHLAALTERLDSVRDALLASDCSRDKLLDLMEEVREETRSHSLMLLRSASRNSERDVLRSSMRIEPLDFANSTFAEPAMQTLDSLVLEEEPPHPIEADNHEKEIKLQKDLAELTERHDALKEENAQLQMALAEASVRFEDYAQKIQTELAAGQSAGQLDLDLSVASENLQRLLSRVQDGGVEVLSLSELAIFRRCTLESTNNASTQTTRSALTEATLLADLKRKTQQSEAEAAHREKSLQERLSAREEQVTALETALCAQNDRIAEEATVAQQLRLEAEKERCRACALDSALASSQLDSMLLRAQLEGETTRHKATLALLENVRADMRNMRRDHAPVPCTSVALSTSSLCCQKELDLEQQVSASLRNAHLLLAQLQAERDRHLCRVHELEMAVEMETRLRKRLEAERTALETTVRQLAEDKRALRTQLENGRGREQWGMERAKLLAEVEQLRHEAVEAKSALSTERAEALLARMRLQYHTPSPHHSAVDDSYDLQDKLTSLGIKCAQLESWRKNLNWQKRYLLLVIGAFEASHHRLRLALKAPTPEPSSVNLFKATALLVVAVLRMTRLAERRLRGQRAPLLIRPMPPSPEPRLQPRAPFILPLTWPRTGNDDEETPRSRYVAVRDEFCQRSDLIQQRLGLNRKF